MKKFCYTVDDNIIFLKEISERSYQSIFEHPYLRMYRRMHEAYGLKVQLNLFYEGNGFTLSQFPDCYREEWAANADWLKLSFHAKREVSKPYLSSGYEEVFSDCRQVHDEILRFASEDSLAKTTTIHFCVATEEGVLALKANGVRGLLGLYGCDTTPRFSYQNTAVEGHALRRGNVIVSDGVIYAGIDVVLNSYPKEEILSQLNGLTDHKLIKVMIHEQYFHPGHAKYQPEFEEKLDAAFDFLVGHGYESIFFEELLP